MKPQCPVLIDIILAARQHAGEVDNLHAQRLSGAQFSSKLEEVAPQNKGYPWLSYSLRHQIPKLASLGGFQEFGVFLSVSRKT